MAGKEACVFELLLNATVDRTWMLQTLYSAIRLIKTQNTCFLSVRNSKINESEENWSNVCNIATIVTKKNCVPQKDCVTPIG